MSGVSQPRVLEVKCSQDKIKRMWCLLQGWVPVDIPKQVSGNSKESFLHSSPQLAATQERIQDNEVLADVFPLGAPYPGLPSGIVTRLRHQNDIRRDELRTAFP